ncbi:MAG: hypothetical protein KIT73_10265 [Burkholderiales bacterium]|nr:hypothetical protein [Burkholderiales bacterium]
MDEFGQLASRLYGSDSVAAPAEPLPADPVAARFYGSQDHVRIPFLDDDPTPINENPDPDESGAESDAPAPDEQGDPSGEIDPATGLPTAVVALRTDPVRKFYNGASTFGKLDTESLFLATEDNAEAVAAAGEEMREIFFDHGASTQEAQEVLELAAANPIGSVSAETFKGWEDGAQRNLELVYGKEANAVLKDAQTLANRDPRVAELLRQTGFGSHPKIVLLFAKLARQERARGRL